MKQIKFRPLRLIKKTGKITVASYGQWRKIKTADYEEFKLIVDESFKKMPQNAFVFNHKGENLFWDNYNPETIPLLNRYDLVDGQRPEYPDAWKTEYEMYCVRGLDVDGVPTFSHNTSLKVANYENIDNFEPLTVKVVSFWVGWFLQNLKNVTF